MTTIKDVAKKADVSLATVSHVVKKTRYVSPNLVRRVEEAIASFDSVPNFVRKQQIKDTLAPKLLLIYLTDFKDSFQKNILIEIREQLEKSSNIIIFPIEYHHLMESFDLITNTIKTNIYGQIIILTSSTLPKTSKKFDKVPHVFISINQIENPKHPVIASNAFMGAKKATNHLLKNGHSKIAFIDHSNNIKNDLVKGYQAALLENGHSIDKTLIATQSFTKQELTAQIRLWSTANIPPTAIMLDPQYFEIAISYFKKIDFQIPKNLSIISMFEENWLKNYSPGITTIYHNYPEISRQALSIIEKGNIEAPEHIIMPTKLNIRESTSGIGRGPFGEKAASIESVKLTENDIQEIRKTQRTAVISFHYIGAPWMKLHRDGIDDIFNQLNINVIAVTDAHFSPDLQNKQIKSLLALEPDIFIAIPTDTKKTAKAFKSIAKSSSRLVLITNVPDGLTPEDYVSVVSVDEHAHGRIAAEGICENLIKENKTNIGIISFDSDFYATNQRDISAKVVFLEDYPDLSIVAETSFKNEDEVYNKTIELLTNSPQINALYVSWDGPALSAIEAAKSLGRSDIIVGTADLDYQLAINMASDSFVKCISAQQPFEQGQAIALAAAQTLLNKPVPSFIGIEPLQVTKKNLLTSWRTIFKEEPPLKLYELID